MQNLLLTANPYGNGHSYGREVKGSPHCLLYDPEKKMYVKRSRWHDYTVPDTIGRVDEYNAFYVEFKWDTDIKFNFIQLCGATQADNHNQTHWKIELQRRQVWDLLDAGQGCWYANGVYKRKFPTVQTHGLRVSLWSDWLVNPTFRGTYQYPWLLGMK